VVGLEHENLDLKGYCHELETNLMGLQKEYESFKAKYMQLEISFNETRSWEGRLVEYENKIAMLSSEIQRLNDMLKREREEKEKMHLIIVDYEGKLREYENKLVLLSSELERLKNMNSQKGEEIEAWRSKYLKIESTMRQIGEFEMRIRVLAEEIDRLNEQHSRDSEEITIYKNKWVEYSNLNNKFNEHMLLFVIIMAENEALRMRVIQKENEVEEVRRQSLTPFRQSVSQSEIRKSATQFTTIVNSEIYSSGMKQSGGQIGGGEVYGSNLRQSGGQLSGEELRRSGGYQYSAQQSSPQKGVSGNVQYLSSSGTKKY